MSMHRLLRSSAAVVFAVSIAGLLAPAADPPLPPPLHEKETTLAWEAYAKGDYQEAIKHADICIQEFRGAAARKQAELDAKKEPVPNGSVTDEQRKAIHQNGPINDVAAAYYVKGRSAHKLGQKDEALRAMAAAEKLPAGRSWDPNGPWFWSPAEAAARFRGDPARADDPPHQCYTADAWAALNGGEYAKAARHADRCATEFLRPAQVMEQNLARAGKNFPTGAVNEATRKEILANGVLNDVGAALYVRGRAAEATGDKPAAVRAYRTVVQLPRARCWDPRGWFWSPAEAAADRLAILR
jgi:tetratricopeptide (TPR) repeat protein